MPHRDTSRTSLLSLSLLIFSAGVVSAAPLPNLMSLEKLDTQIAEASPTLILAQDTGSPPSAPGKRKSMEPIELWLLGFIVLGLPFFLFWLKSLRGTKTAGKPSILILTPEPGESGRVYWEVSQRKIEALQRQGGKQMVVRLLDVTDINPQITDPAIVAQAKCSPLVNLLSIPIPQLDREYQAELGYLTTDEYWLPLVKSAPTYFAAPKSLFGNLGSPSPTMVTTVGNLDIAPTPIAPATFPTKSPETSSVTSPPVSSVSPTPVISSPSTPLEISPVEIGAETKEISETELTGEVAKETSEAGASITDPWTTPDTFDTPEQPTIVTTTLPTPVSTPLESELEEVLHPEVTEKAAEEVTEEVAKIEAPIPEVSPLISESTPDLIPDLTSESTASPASLADKISDTIPDPIEPEVTTTIPPVVPTIDDGASNLNWGVASAVVPESTSELIPETSPEIDSALITEPEPEVVSLPSIETQINLTTPEAGKIQVTWEIDPTEVDNCKAQGGKDLGLRVYDATDIDISYVAPHSTHEYFCDAVSRELIISAPLGDRIYGDYIAELGYLTETREWIRVIRSLHIRVVR